MWIISKSHRENFFFFIFLQSIYQVGMKNGVKCYKDFFPYFKALKTNCDLSLLYFCSYPTRYKNGGSKFLYNFFTTVSRFFGRQRKGKSISTTSRGQKKVHVSEWVSELNFFFSKSPLARPFNGRK